MATTTDLSMSATRYLIVNADDLGQSPGVNEGILRAHEHGIVTSASLMVRWPAAAAAVAAARSYARLSLGLHVDLGEWIYREESWTALYDVVPTDDPQAVRAEIERQLDVFQQLVGRAPTHLDSHQHVHREDPARAVLLEASEMRSIPLRHFSRTVRYRGDFYGQTSRGEPCSEAIGVPALMRILDALEPGITELGCHPGLGADMPSMYGRERSLEVQTLTSPEVRQHLAERGISLISFADPAITRLA